MRIAFRDARLETSSSPSKEALLEQLQGCRLGALLLGEDAEQESAFYLVKWMSSKGDFGIGIVSEGHGLVPELLLREKEGVLVIGFNKQVAGIAPDRKEVVFSRRFASLFRDFISQPGQALFLVAHECGVARMSAAGRTAWEHAGDLIEAIRLRERYIEIDFMDEPSVRIDLQTGARIKTLEREQEVPTPRRE